MNPLGRLHQTHQVRAKLKNPFVVDPDTLKDTVSVQEAVVKDADLGFRTGDQVPVDPNQSLIGGGSRIGI